MALIYFFLKFASVNLVCFLARLDEVQEELLYYPGVCIGVGFGVDVGVGGGVGVSKMLKFYVKVFYVMGKALSGELSCPYDRCCWCLKS